MILEIDKNQLIKSVSIADSVVSSKSVNTILSQCLFVVKDDMLTVMGTDNEIGVKTRVDVVADGDGSFAVNGKRLISLLKEFPDGIVILKVDSSGMHISMKGDVVKGSYTMVVSSAEEYPIIPDYNFEDAFEIEQNVFYEMLRKTIHAAAHDTVKPIFNGVYLVADESGEYLSVVATDSRRLALMKRRVSNIEQLKTGVILPLKTIQEILRLLDDTGTCLFSVDGSKCFVKIGKTEIVSRLIDGQFPDYKQVIPKDFLFKAIVETKKMRDALGRIKNFTSEPSWRILMRFSSSLLVMEASYPEHGEGKEEVVIESDCKEPITIGINVNFLLDLFDEIESYSTVIGITGVMSPVVIRPEDDEHFLSVIMPIQIRSV